MKNPDAVLFRAALRIFAALPLVLTAAPPAVADDTVKTASAQVQLTTTQVLIMGGTGYPTPDQHYMDTAINNYIRPALGEADYHPVAVYTPEQGLGLLEGETMSMKQSTLAGAAYLEAAIASYPGQRIVVFGFSQSGAISNLVKNSMADYAAQHPDEPVPDVTFVWCGGGARANGSDSYRTGYDPATDPFDDRGRTDTPFKTIDIAMQYDIASDHPIYNLNLLADLNVLLGGLYSHNGYLPLPADNPKTKQLAGFNIGGQFASLDGLQGVTAPGLDTTYYFIPGDNLPLFGPLRSLGVPEALIDIIEPVARVIVEWAYDRTIPPWQPTPYSSGLPNIDPAVAITQLVNAVGEGIANAFTAFGIQLPAAAAPGPAAPRVVPTARTTNRGAARSTRSNVHAASVANAKSSPTQSPARTRSLAASSKASRAGR